MRQLDVGKECREGGQISGIIVTPETEEEARHLLHAVRVSEEVVVFNCMDERHH